MDKIKPLFTATATAVGGRNGHSKSNDGIVAVDLSVPKEMGGPGKPGTATPEHLFAAGYAACFGGAIDFVAKQRKKDAGKAIVPQSGHSSARFARPLSANSGHSLGVSLVAILTSKLGRSRHASRLRQKFERLRLVTVSRTPTFGGPGGGEYEISCPFGSVMTGLRARHGLWIDALAPICSRYVKQRKRWARSGRSRSLAAQAGARGLFAVTRPGASS